MAEEELMCTRLEMKAYLSDSITGFSERSWEFPCTRTAFFV